MSIQSPPRLPLTLHGGEVGGSPTWASAPAGADAPTETFFTASRAAFLHGRTEGDVYRNGHNSWSPSGWRAITDAPLRVANPVRRQTADDTRWDDPARHHSSWMIAVASEQGTLLLGCLDGETPRLHADTDLVSAWTETGRSASWVLLEGDELAVFARYRDLLVERHGSLSQAPGAVWSSWYSYYETISRADLDEVVPQLPGLGFDTVQVDDGWERLVGDWHPNDKFSAGMKDTVSLITDHGMRAGLWIAPFITLPDAEVVQKNPQMLLRDASGSLVHAGTNWGSHYYTFDFTRPDAQGFLVDTVSRAVHDWGFSYLKLDFINAGTVEGVRSQDVDREQAYRTAIETIRAAVGPDTYLLGSGAPVFSSLGVLNAVRTGPDVAPMWDNYATDDPSDATAHNALSNAVSRLWMRGLVGLDPDVVYFRHRRNLLSDQQMQWLKDCATLSGFPAVSDPPAWIDAEDHDELRTFLTTSPATEQVGRYRFRIEDREVDFGPVFDDSDSFYPL